LRFDFSLMGGVKGAHDRCFKPGREAARFETYESMLLLDAIPFY
jgi:hypothetical protein